MSSRHDRWTAAISLALVLGALLACKRKKEAEPETAPSATAPPPATTAAATAPAAPAGPKLGDVKRYPDKEKKEDEAAVKILEDNVKVFNEADAATPPVATLPKDLAVVRLSRLDQEGFTLIDFPSGVGQFSPGWVESKFLEAKGQQVARDKVLTQDKKAEIQPTTNPGSTAAPATTQPAATTTTTAKTAAAPAPTLSLPQIDINDLKKAAELAKDAGISLPPPPATATGKN